MKQLKSLAITNVSTLIRLLMVANTTEIISLRVANTGKIPKHLFTGSGKYRIHIPVCR